MTGRATGRWLGILLLLLGVASAPAQIDPVKRRVFQAGYSVPFEEHGPIAAYGFYYLNLPNKPRTNQTLRLAVVPVYFDSEIGFHEALGPETDVAVGLSGGGFYDSYNEFQRGNYLTDESFTGHSATASSVIYHLFNPGHFIPLNGILRSGMHGAIYSRDDDTADGFDIPDDLATFFVRGGLRLGGREPYLTPKLAGEVSLWHESKVRLNADNYGFSGDRQMEDYSGRFWARALLAYTFEESEQFVEVSVTSGTMVNPDRLNAYRLGGNLSMRSEFPLNLPGYHIEEISADQFVLMSAQYLVPLDPTKRVALTLFGSAALVDYTEGLEQPGDFHSGAGGGLFYLSRSRAWQVGMVYSYGIDAMRNHGRGAHTISFQLQYDLEAEQLAGDSPFWNPLLSTKPMRGFLRFFKGNRL